MLWFSVELLLLFINSMSFLLSCLYLKWRINLSFVIWLVLCCLELSFLTIIDFFGKRRRYY